jgi:2-hydroxychromene-2-carboxylate isomerase
MSAVQFWLEFGSTYSYLAAMRIEGYAATRGIPFEWRPFLLGPIFRKQGWSDSPFNLNEARGRYMWRDVERHCEALGLPFKKPTVFPRNGLTASRVAIAGVGSRWLPDFVRAVYTANFGEDREIGDATVIAEILTGLRLDARAQLAAAQEQTVKDRLREETDRAWASGVFGAPTFIVDGEVFWGNDRLEQAFDWHARRSASALR